MVLKGHFLYNLKNYCSTQTFVWTRLEININKDFFPLQCFFHWLIETKPENIQLTMKGLKGHEVNLLCQAKHKGSLNQKELALREMFISCLTSDYSVATTANHNSSASSFLNHRLPLSSVFLNIFMLKSPVRFFSG